MRVEHRNVIFSDNAGVMQEKVRKRINRETGELDKFIGCSQALGESQWIPSKTDKPVMSARWQSYESPALILPQKYSFLLPPVEESTFMGAQKSRRDIAVLHWSKKSESKCTEEGKKSNFILLMSLVS